MTEKLVTLFFGVDCAWRQRPKSTKIYDTFCLVPGIYLPLLWEPSFCSRSPISLGYTRGHFCALVPPEPTSLAAAMAAAVYSAGTGAMAASFGASSTLTQSSTDVKSTYLPLTTYVQDHYLNYSVLDIYTLPRC